MHSITILLVLFTVYVVILVLTTGKMPGGTPVTEERYIELGVDEEVYIPLLEKNGLR